MTKKLIEENTISAINCPECGNAQLVVKTNIENGNQFLACPIWSKCTHTQEIPECWRMIFVKRCGLTEELFRAIYLRASMLKGRFSSNRIADDVLVSRGVAKKVMIDLYHEGCLRAVFNTECKCRKAYFSPMEQYCPKCGQEVTVWFYNDVEFYNESD